MFKIIGLILFCNAFTASMHAQTLLKNIEDSMPAKEKVVGAFKSTRVINAHSIEMLHRHNLDFRIMHRFGFLSTGVKQLYGLDNATMRISFDYGLTDNTTIGFGRSTFRKELDIFLKQRLLQQSRGADARLFSLIIIAGSAVWTEPSSEPVKPGFADRSSFYVQLVAGRKLSPVLSVQISPIVVHSNTPANVGDDKTIFAMGGGARLKVSKRMAITVDYHHPFEKLNVINTDPLSVGVDIETGGHVFQLQFSNATGMNERAYITQTSGAFFKGDIRFGFNLSRIFKLGKKNTANTLE